jgi:hypothetical protein
MYGAELAQYHKVLLITYLYLLTTVTVYRYQLVDPCTLSFTSRHDRFFLSFIMKLYLALAATLPVCSVLAISVNEITSGKYSMGTWVDDVSGVVTAILPPSKKPASGAKTWIEIAVRSTAPELASPSSNSIFVRGFNETNITVGDTILFSGKIDWSRSPYYPEVFPAASINRVSSNAAIEPVLIGPGGRLPLNDAGEFDVDFWGRSSSELVLITNVTVVTNSDMGFAYVRGDWSPKSVNSRGGLTKLASGKTIP